MREFRNKNKIEDQQRPSSNAFDSYVDGLVKNGAGSQSNANASAREARKKFIKDCHDQLRQRQNDQKQALNKLRYEQKQLQRRAQGKGRVDIEEVLYEERIGRIARGVLSNITIEQRNLK